MLKGYFTSGHNNVKRPYLCYIILFAENNTLTLHSYVIQRWRPFH